MAFIERTFPELRIGDCVGVDNGNGMMAAWVVLLAHSPVGRPVVAMARSLEDISARIMEHETPEYMELGGVLLENVKANASTTRFTKTKSFQNKPAGRDIYPVETDHSFGNYCPPDDMLLADFKSEALLTATQSIQLGMRMQIVHERGVKVIETVRGIAVGINGPLSLQFDSLPDEWISATDMNMFVPVRNGDGFINIDRLQEVHHFNA